MKDLPPSEKEIEKMVHGDNPARMVNYCTVKYLSFRRTRREISK